MDAILLLFFIRTFNSSFETYKEMVKLVSLNYATKLGNIFKVLKNMASEDIGFSELFTFVTNSLVASMNFTAFFKKVMLSLCTLSYTIKYQLVKQIRYTIIKHITSQIHLGNFLEGPLCKDPSLQPFHNYKLNQEKNGSLK